MRFAAMILVLLVAYTVRAEVGMQSVQRCLFIDDHHIQSMSNLQRTMHRPKKKGAVIRPRTDLGLAANQVRTAPIGDERAKVYRLWDCSTPADLHRRGIYTGGYNESRDGLHWYQPTVGQVEFRGSRENHFVSVVMGGRHFRPDCVVFDPGERDPAKRFKGLSFSCPATDTALQSGMVLRPVAWDGRAWRPLEGQALPSGDEFNLSYDATDAQFIATVKVGGPFGRCVGLYTSRDFRTWTDYGLVFHADDTDQERGRRIIRDRFADPKLQHPVFNHPEDYNVDIYNMAVFRYEDLYIGLPAVFYATGRTRAGTNKDGFHHVQLACSRNLREWTRVGDRAAFIGPSPLGAGAYDLTQIIGPSFPVVRDEELWFYYTGLKYRSVPDDADADQGAVCLAVLRREGFVSLDAGEEEGSVLTKPFSSAGETLFVNVDAKGMLRAEVIDESGKIAAVSEPVTGDHPRIAIRWKTGRLADHRGRRISVRFTLRNARFYSYWIE